MTDSSWIHLSVFDTVEAQRGRGGRGCSVEQELGGRGCHDSHLRVSHWGLGGRVSISGGGGGGPIFWWRLSIDGGLVEGLLG